MHFRVVHASAVAVCVLFISACSGGVRPQTTPAAPAGSSEGNIHLSQALQRESAPVTSPDNEEVLIQVVDCPVGAVFNGRCGNNPTNKIMIQRYNLASGAALPPVTVQKVGVPTGTGGQAPSRQQRSLFVTADDSTFITPSGSQSEIDHTNGSSTVVNFGFQSMSTDLTTVEALDPSSDLQNGPVVYDTFRTPYTTVFQRGKTNQLGIFYGLLNRGGSMAVAWAGQSAFSAIIGFTTIPGNNNTFASNWSNLNSMCWLGPDVVDGTHNLYYAFLAYESICSVGPVIPDEISIMNLTSHKPAGYINLPPGYHNAFDVSQINGDLFVPVGSNIDVWNVPACGCARVQRVLPGYFTDAIPVADRSGQHLILFGHPSPKSTEVDVIGVNALTGALEHTYFKGIAASFRHLDITSVLAQ